MSDKYCPVRRYFNRFTLSCFIRWRIDRPTLSHSYPTMLRFIPIRLLNAVLYPAPLVQSMRNVSGHSGPILVVPVGISMIVHDFFPFFRRSKIPFDCSKWQRSTTILRAVTAMVSTHTTRHFITVYSVKKGKFFRHFLLSSRYQSCCLPYVYPFSQSSYSTSKSSQKLW